MADIVRRDLRPTLSRTVIPRALARKQKLTWGERLWVYFDAVIAIPCLFILLGSIYMSVAKDDFWAAHMILSFIIGTPFFIRMVMKIDSPDESWADRKRLLEYDKARKAAAHSAERKGRYTDVRYEQYSVWTEQQHDEIVFSILKHTPPEPFPEPEAHWLKWTATKTKKGYAGEQESDASMRLVNPTYERVQAQAAKLDETAAELEQKSYLEAVRRAEISKLALTARRPEGPKRVVKDLKDKDHERTLEHAITRDYQPSE